MDRLKKNQIPDGFDKEGYDKYLAEREEFAKKQKELEEQELEGKGQWEALKMQLVESHNNTFSSFKEEANNQINSLKNALDKELVENNLIKAIEAEKGNSLFLLPHMKNSVKTAQDESGNYTVQVVDEKGNQRFLDDGNPFTPKDLVAEFKAKDIFAPAFPDFNQGSGDPNANGGQGGSGPNPWKADSKNVTEQARITKENPTLATQLKKAAGVA